jgi:hypothetical protein
MDGKWLVLVMVACTWNRAVAVTYAAAVATVACDWGQTRQSATDGWRGAAESNPVLGERPSPAAVDAYFFAAEALLTAVLVDLNSKWSAFAFGGLAAVETRTIINNGPLTRGFCGVGRSQ